MKDKKYKFYKYENNPEGSDYCFCQRPCDSNMSLHCFLDNGEILGFMSESLVYKHPEIKEIDMNEFMHDFIKPLIKENQQLKEKLEESEKEYGRTFGLWHNRKLIKKFDDEYDEADKKNNPERDYAYVMPDAEEVYKRYYELKEKLEASEKARKDAIELIKEKQRKDEFLELNEWQTRDLLSILDIDKGE